MAETIIKQEATGVFQGILLENMIDTVTKTHKLYCDVDIPQFYEKTLRHPLTYVPLWAMTLPLKQGDKVYVKFHQNNPALPILWKTASDVDKGMYEKFNFPSGVTGGNIKTLTPVNTFYSQKFGDNSFIIKTANYTVLRQNNAYILLDKDDKVYIQGSEINQIATGDYKVDASGSVKFFSPSGKFNIGNNSDTLGSLLKELTDFLSKDLCSALAELHTEGSPAEHTAALWAAEKIATPVTGLLSKISVIQTKINNVFPSSSGV